MKRITLLTIICLLITFPVSAGVMYSLTPISYPVLVDGSQLKSDLPVMNYKGSTYVPLKAVLDMMGAKTEWDGKKVNISTGQASPEEVANSVVMIYVLSNGKRVSQGSGVLIDYDEILTVSHLTDSGTGYEIIYNDGSTTTATLEKDAPSLDVSILEPEKKDVKPVKIGDSEEIKVGDKIFVVSSPKQKKNVISIGVYLDFYYTNGINGFRVTAVSGPGGSGGGIFNKNGELTGIIEAGRDTFSFAVPINDIRKILSN